MATTAPPSVAVPALPMYGYGYNHGCERRNDHSSQEHMTLANTIADGTLQVSTAVGATRYDVTKAVDDGDRDILRAICDTNMYVAGQVANGTSTVSSAVERNGGETRAAVERNGNDTRSAIERNGGDNITATERGRGDVLTAIERNGGNAATLAIQNLSHLLISDKEILQAICQSKGHLSEVVKDGFSSTKLQLCEVENRLSTRADDKFFALAGQSAAGFAKAELQAEKLAFAASKQLSECCCEIKGMVVAAGQKTDDLIASIERQRLRDANDELRDKLSEAKIEASIIKLGASLGVTVNASGVRA